MVYFDIWYIISVKNNNILIFPDKLLILKPLDHLDLT